MPSKSAIRRPRWTLFARALACGAALACGFKLGFLPWFALAPVFLGDGREPRRRSFATGFAAGTGYYAVLLHWIEPAFQLAGSGPAYSWTLWLLLAAFGGLHWGLLWLAAERSVDRFPSAAKPWAWAVFWTAGMTAWERWLPWPCLSLAYTQASHLRLLQMTPVFGHHALDFLIVAVNVALAQTWQSSWRERASRANLAALAALLGAFWVFGWRTLNARRPPKETARIEILHPETASNRRWDANAIAAIAGGFDELLLRPRPKDPAMIFWHEGSLPRWVQAKDALPEAAKWSRRLRAYQLVGAYSSESGAAFNSVYALGPDGNVSGVYRQRALIPLLEAMPQSKRLRALLGSGNNPLAVPLTAGGSDQPLFLTPLGLFSVSICFESDFPEVARADAARGARLLFEASNDAWFPDSWEPEEHLAVDILRAVENRFTVVRAANYGISAVIDPWGAVVARLGPSRRGRLDAEVDSRDAFRGRSFYTRHGDMLGLLCLTLAAALSLWTSLPLRTSRRGAAAGLAN